MGTATTNAEREEGVIYRYEDDLVTAIDLESGVASSGKSKSEALAMLAEALELHEGGGEPVEDEAAVLRELDLDPDEIEQAREQNKDVPDFLR